MERVYHPKERLKYFPEDVSAALAHVRRGMSIRKTARRFKIPYETLASFSYKRVFAIFARYRIWVLSPRFRVHIQDMC